MLEIVEAQLCHWPDIKEMLSRTADEDDYVLFTWQEWLQHPEKGMTFVALWDGKPVGTTHIAYLDEENCWLQGIRIAPEMQGKGIGKAMSANSVAFAKKKGFRVARCGIDADNHVSQHVTGLAGFVKVFDYQAYLKNDVRQPNTVRGNWEPAGEEEIAGYLAAMAKNPAALAANGFMVCFDFIALGKSDQMKEAILYDDQPHFYRYQENGQTLAWIDAFYGDEDDLAEQGYLIMGQVAQEPAIWQQALPAIEAEAVKHDCSAVMFWADDRDPVVDYLLKNGYRAKAGQGYQLWEQKL
ncbi:MAG: GNAT family N-acetyltransferase [Negativicutes bacterium]|nr:GNAT family N-acetyltransferase [Negativicutes bacterium]